MLAIVIPAHNEEDCIAACLDAASVAARHPDLHGEEVKIVLVLDNCTDDTAEIAASYRHVHLVHINARKVGVARAMGASIALCSGARWLAFTDADTLVPPDWLAVQLALDADAVCGIVDVQSWEFHDDSVRQHFYQTYRAVEGHRHVHGANLGLSAAAYIRCGGFPPLPLDEDVTLVAALEEAGARIAWTAATRVLTSARKTFKARGGFGETLMRIGQSLDISANDGAVAPISQPAVAAAG